MNFQFESLSEFWHMAGHGPYVWGCYLVTAMLLIYVAVTPVLRRRRFLKEQGRQRRLQARAATPETVSGDDKIGAGGRVT